jgi:hypothetical protein
VILQTLCWGFLSSNCTFETTKRISFSTLGISHVYVDITKRIRVLNETVVPGSSDNSTIAYLALEYGIDQTMGFSTQEFDVLMTWVSP